MTPRSLAGRTIVMSRGSRGIGLAIAVRAAQDGANVVLLAKTGELHARLTGTVHTAAAEVVAAGGAALARGRRPRRRGRRARRAAGGQRFCGVDVVVNNASALDLRPTREIDMKRYDLMQDINARGSFLLSKTASRTSNAATTRTSSRCRRLWTCDRSGPATTSPAPWRSTG